METAFAFKAVRRDGGFETGVVLAPSREAAAALIGRRGSFAIEVSAHSAEQRTMRHASLDDLAAGLRALATLLSSGIPVARAMVMMDDLVSGSWVAALPQIRRQVEQGERLGTALEGAGLGIPPYVIGMIGAGEAAGGLSPAVQRAALLLETSARNRADLRNALAYPAVLAVAGTASVALLVGVVLPRFADLLTDAGQSLPVSTRLVLAAATMAKLGFLPLLGLGLAALGAWRVWTRRPDGLLRWHRFMLSLPILGPIRRSGAAANVSAALAALIDAGVPLAAALPHAARATGDAELQSRLLTARERIVRGAAISAALEGERAITPTVIRLVRLGEETGRLSELLAQAASIESAQVLQRVQHTIRVVEPTLILLFGGAVMVVAAALLQAMYGLRPG